MIEKSKYNSKYKFINNVININIILCKTFAVLAKTETRDMLTCSV